MPSALSPDVIESALRQLNGVADNLRNGRVALCNALRSAETLIVLCVHDELDRLIAEHDQKNDGSVCLQLFQLTETLKPISQPFIRTAWTEMTMAIATLRDCSGEKRVSFRLQ